MRFVVRQTFRGATSDVTEGYRRPAHAQREALACAERWARAGIVGGVVEVVDDAGAIVWSARIPERYKIELKGN